VESVWKSDRVIPEELSERFHVAIKRFSDGISEVDYHPGSNDQVINLVHPSLFCLVYGKSTDKEGNVIEWMSHPDITQMWSERYQWLPAEFLVDNTGKVKIETYINSLPVDSGLYPILAEIFEHIVPMFNRVLTDLRVHRCRIRFPRPEGYDWFAEYDPPDEIYEGIEDDNDAQEGKVKEWMEAREIIPLPIPDFDEEDFKIDPKDFVDLKGHRLQVIVKIGSIELTPEKPKFPGGSWHVEGMANEKIVATAIYYYDSENIQGDRLNFRQSVELDIMEFAQDDEDGATRMFGIGRDSPMVQYAGTAQTPSGSVLVFPNIYQHSVEAFELEDKSKTGHRKILVFFLVDPTQRIVSTARVPPQDIRWHDSTLQDQLNSKLTVEIARMISGQVGYQMTLDEAKAHRLQLMEERSVAKDVVTQAVFERPFRLCEH